MGGRLEEEKKFHFSLFSVFFFFTLTPYAPVIGNRRRVVGKRSVKA
tara:strand:- start:110 stop:247 length:138 start_codon:yes stop_codon:yes gene_type:complete